MEGEEDERVEGIEENIIFRYFRMNKNGTMVVCVCVYIKYILRLHHEWKPRKEFQL